MKLTNLALCIALGATAVAAPAFAQDITLKASHNANADEPYGVGMRKMAEILEEKTDGAATIEVFDNATLGDEMESIQGTQIGTVDIAVTANSTLSNFVPDLSVFSLPFLFDDAEQMDRALSDPEVLDAIGGALDAQGFHLLAVFSAGTRHIMTKEPIESLADLEGLKIRTMQNPAHVDTFNAFGANATPIAYTELYGALETGVVDGAEAANTNFFSQKFYEVAPDWAVVGWLELVAPVIMGKAAERLAGTSNFAKPGFAAETQVMAMDLAGVCISAGSACSSGKVKRSLVLLAMGASDALAESAIRTSFGWNSTPEDFTGVADAWLDAARRTVLKETA